MVGKKENSVKCSDCLGREYGIFCDSTGDDLSKVSEHKIVNTYSKGQTLFVQGNPPYGMYCVSQGNIKVTKMGEDGREAIVRIATKGDVLGHRSLFTDQYYSATATALEDCVVCFLDKKFILKMVQETPSIATNLISKLGRDMGAAENRVASMSQKNVRERLAELILLLKESHGVVEEGRVRLDLKLPREEMASIIGTAPETLIRFLSELKKEGFIAQEGKVLYLVDEKGLVDFANISY